MRHFIWAGILSASVALVTVGCTTTPTEQRSESLNPNQQFEALANEAWDYNLMQFPRVAARRGDTEAAGRLMDNSPAALAARYEARKAFYEQLDAIDPASLSEENQINRDIILYALRNQLANYQFNMYMTPLTNETGPQNAIARSVTNQRIQNLTDAHNYISQLNHIPAALQQQADYMRQGIALGITQPAVVLYGMPDSIQAYIQADPTESLFYAPIAAARARLSESDFRRIDIEAQTAISTQVNVAYTEFYDFMVNEYIPNARTDIAAVNLPNGEAFYANRVKHYTTMDLSPEEIHNIGLAEVRRIRAEMQQVIDDLEFEGSFADFIDFLRSDPQFYATSAEELLKEAAYISKRADAVLPRFFKHLPRTPYGVVAVPAEIAPTYTTGRYASASNEYEAGYYWVNTYALDRRPLYELEALTLHEAVPGHHLQIALAQEMEGVPDYRRSTYISAFGEGWGLYAEYLGLEAGFYQDPYSNFGRLTYEMWRAARLVVDTGMHTMGWTRDQAVEFMASNTALSMHNVNTEIDRYISWPAQALAYKLGEILIRNLRAEAEEALGEHFDIREFHYQVLRNGSIPLATLEAQVRAYIESAKAEL